MAQSLTPTPDSASSHCCGDRSCTGASQWHAGAPSTPHRKPGSPAPWGEDRSWWGRLGQLLSEGCVGSVHPGNENQPPGNECSSFGLLRLENTGRRKSQRQESTAGGAGRDRRAPPDTPDHRGRGAEELGTACGLSPPNDLGDPSTRGDLGLPRHEGGGRASLPPSSLFSRLKTAEMP